jgi:protein SCO1
MWGGVSFGADTSSDIPMAKSINNLSLPNIELTDQDGRKVRLFDDLIKDKIVAINFIFTSCDAMCPMETARLKTVSDMIGDRMGKDIFFISISIDPAVDTPEVLKAYRAKFGITKGWNFYTGDEAQITAARKRLGLFVNNIERVKSDHALEMLVGNEKTGQWMRRSGMDKAEVLRSLIADRLSGYRYTNGRRNDFAKAPTRLEPITKGEEIFTTRCHDCHKHGGGDGIGPDLKNVTHTRDTAWLRKWLTDPGAVVAAKDPVALAIVAKFNGLVMPNLSLSESDVSEVIEYLRGLDGKKTSMKSREDLRR